MATREARDLPVRVEEDLSGLTRLKDVVMFMVRAHFLPLFLLICFHYSIALAMHNVPIDIWPVGYFVRLLSLFSRPFGTKTSFPP